MKNTRLYLAYGSNLNIQQMKYRCPSAKVLGIVYLKGYKLAFKGREGRAFLTLEKDPEGTVPIGVWETTKMDERYLNMYEGYPTHYRKEVMDITYYDEVKGEWIDAQGYIYIMNNGVLAAPSEHYMNTCLHGYWDFEFDPKHLYEALDEVGGETYKYSY